MADLEFFRANFDRFLADAQVQIESLSNDLKDLPNTLQQVVIEGQGKVEEVKALVEQGIADLQSGELLSKDYTPEIKDAVEKLETAVQEIYVSIRNAIENAKES